MDKQTEKFLDEWLEEYDDGDYDIMVDDTLYYILHKLGENGVPETIASKIRHYAIELCRDALWPIELADRISKQAIAKYKENNYSDHWKEHLRVDNTMSV